MPRNIGDCPRCDSYHTATYYHSEYDCGGWRAVCIECGFSIEQPTEGMAIKAWREHKYTSPDEDTKQALLRELRQPLAEDLEAMRRWLFELHERVTKLEEPCQPS